MRWPSALGTLGLLLAGELLTLASCGLATPGLRHSFPVGVPDATGWETSSGAAQFGSPGYTVEYQLYVSPEREAVYTLARYRVSFDDPAERERNGIDATEKMQWDVDGRELHRYECVGAVRASDPCEWHELRAGTPEFKRETPILLMLFGLHRRLLHEQEKRHSR